jgi:hypothetical protein
MLGFNLKLLGKKTRKNRLTGRRHRLLDRKC